MKKLQDKKDAHGSKTISFTEEIRSMLLEEKALLLRDVDDRRKEESSPHKFEMGDNIDIASSERARELSLILGDRELLKLRDIDEALVRLDTGNYGICDECEEPISEGRLRVLPFTRVCVECKAKEERLEQSGLEYERDDRIMNMTRRPDNWEEES